MTVAYVLSRQVPFTTDEPDCCLDGVSVEEREDMYQGFEDIHSGKRSVLCFDFEVVSDPRSILGSDRILMLPKLYPY